MDKKVTMQDIADKLGITKVSVSKAINNQQGVSEDLRKKILRTAKEMEYVRNTGITGTEYRFAFICPKRYFLEDDVFYTTLYYYINKKCTNKGSSVTCFIINSTDETSLTLPQQLLSAYFDGIFIAGEFRKDYLMQLIGLPGEKIAIDFYLPDLQIDCVATDNFYLGQKVTDYLIRNGHERIGFVGDITGSSSICDRYFGVLKALTQKRLKMEEQWRIVNNDVLTGQYEQTVKLPEPLPTAFVCHCDKAALMLTRQLQAAGVSTPGDVSIISFDNVDLCELMNPPLTSINFDKHEIADRSIKLMWARLENPSSPPCIQYVQGTLIERESVCRLL